MLPPPSGSHQNHPLTTHTNRTFRGRSKAKFRFCVAPYAGGHRDQADADDLVQDTLVRALANAHLYEPGSDLRAWLFTIMRNQFFAGAAKANRFISMLRVFAETDHGAGGDRARPGSYYVMSPEPSGGCRASSASLSCSPALRVSPMRTSRRRWGSRSAPFAAIWHAAATG